MKNIKFFVVYIYIVPAILALYLIVANGHLIGDFRAHGYELSFWGAVFVFLQFCAPLLFLAFLLKAVNRVVVFKEKNHQFINFVQLLLIIVFLVTLLFGAVQIGVPSQGGIAGIMTSLVVKLNPYLLVLILSFSSIKPHRFIFCLFVCLFYTYEQHSLQGYLIAFIASAVFYFNKQNMSLTKMLVLLLTPIVLSGVVVEVLKFIYATRNEMRGGDVGFLPEEIVYLAVGRISALSSYIYVQDKILDYSAISDFFSWGILSSRFTGVPIVGTYSPSDLFNQHVLGDADYSIFLGVSGFLFVLFQASLPVFIVNLVPIVFVLVVIYFLIPYFDAKQRLSMFFILLYMFFLSSDIWELSIFFQSLIFINLLYFFYKCSIASLPKKVRT